MDDVVTLMARSVLNVVVALEEVFVALLASVRVMVARQLSVEKLEDESVAWAKYQILAEQETVVVPPEKAQAELAIW